MKAWFNALIILVVTSSNAASALDLDRVAQAHVELDAFHIEVRVRLLKDGQSIREIQGAVKKLGSLSLSELQHLTVLSNERCTLVVDKRNKTIFFGGPGRFVRRNVQADADRMLEAARERARRSGASVADLGVTPHGHHLRITSPEGDIAVTDLYLNPSTYLVEKIVYTYRDAGDGPTEVVIDYDWKDPAEVSLRHFSEERFIIRAGSELRPRPEFIGYRVVRVDQDD